MTHHAGVAKTERDFLCGRVGGSEIPAETCSCRVATAVMSSLPD